MECLISTFYWSEKFPLKTKPFRPNQVAEPISLIIDGDTFYFWLNSNKWRRNAIRNSIENQPVLVLVSQIQKLDATAREDHVEIIVEI